MILLANRLPTAEEHLLQKIPPSDHVCVVTVAATPGTTCSVVPTAWHVSQIQSVDPLQDSHYFVFLFKVPEIIGGLFLQQSNQRRVLRVSHLVILA